MRVSADRNPLSGRSAARAARRSPAVALRDVAARHGASTETLRNALTGLATRGGCGQMSARLVAAGGAAAVAGLVHRACPPPVTRLAAEPSTADGRLDAAGVLPLTGPARWAARLSTSRTSIRERVLVAGRVDCPPSLIPALAQDTSAAVRAAVAGRVDCPTRAGSRRSPKTTRSACVQRSRVGSTARRG